MATTDLMIQNRCDHRILGDIAQISGDKRTIVPKYAVASEGSFELYRYDLLVPRSRYSFIWLASNIEGQEIKAIILKERDRSPSPIYSLNYVTDSTLCPKCLGTNFSDDLSLDGQGDIKQVEGYSQLAQNVEKSVITDSSSNRYHPWFGNQLRSLIGTKSLDGDFIKSEIRNQIRSGINKFKETQMQHADSNPTVDLQEQLDEIVSIDVERDDADPTVYRALVKYTSLGGAVFEFNTLVDLQNFRVR